MYNYKSFKYQDGRPALHFNDFVIFRTGVRQDCMHTFELEFENLIVPFAATPSFERGDDRVLVVSWDLFFVSFDDSPERSQKAIILNKIRFFLKNYIPSSEAGKLGSYKELTSFAEFG